MGTRKLLEVINALRETLALTEIHVRRGTMLGAYRHAQYASGLAERIEVELYRRTRGRGQ